MKKIIVIIGGAVLISATVFACQSKDPVNNTTKEDVTLSSEESDFDHPNEDETLDIEAYLRKLSKDHPEASCDELTDMMMKNPYFLMFQKQSLDSYYPGMDYEFTPQGLKEASCLINYVIDPPVMVYVLTPEEGTDAKTLADSFEKGMDTYFSEFEEIHEKAFYEAGKAFFTLYREDMKPVIGDIASKPRELVSIFHEYRKNHPEANSLEICEYLGTHQKFTASYTQKVNEGNLTGFGDFEHEGEITGFEEGAALLPQMMPNLFLSYVFKLEKEEDTDTFISKLKDNANLAWNVCMVANTVITESDDNYVLFIMCSEETAE